MWGAMARALLLLLCVVPALALLGRATPVLDGAAARGCRRAAACRAAAATQEEEINGLDPAYPWRFDGRLWFRPALVRSPSPDALPEGMTPVALFGWTIGGVVALGARVASTRSYCCLTLACRTNPAVTPPISRPTYMIML